MRLCCSFVSTFAVIFSFIECSSHSDRNPHSGHHPGSDPSFADGEQHTPDWTFTDEPQFRARSRSPPGRPHSIRILGYSLDELGYVRLIPRTNRNLRFEFRNYILEAGTQIWWKSENKYYSPVPAQEYIVLSTYNGDIFAILETSGILRGIYGIKSRPPRVKMHIMSRAIFKLTPDEIRDCPVGRNRPISSQNFIKAFANDDSLQFKWHPGGERSQKSLPSARQHPPNQIPTVCETHIRVRSESPPDRPPTGLVHGYTMEQLGYLRLIPCGNPNQRFEFRRYIFLTEESIRTRIDRMSYVISPTREYIVLSTSTGDVYAILDHSGTLRGIYRADSARTRMKINMISGTIEDLTSEDKRDCPVGKSHPIFSRSFNKTFANYNSLNSEQHPHSENNPRSHSPGRQHIVDRTFYQEPPRIVRSSSPPGRPPSHEVLGIPIAQLGYIRLIPLTNSNQKFEFRRYSFPDDKKIQLSFGNGTYVFVSTREHIVLSTSDGDVFAILEFTGLLRGIYRAHSSHARIKINMISGQIENMTASEVNECHVGKNYPIFPRWFTKAVSNENSLNYVYY